MATENRGQVPSKLVLAASSTTKEAVEKSLCGADQFMDNTGEHGCAKAYIAHGFVEPSGVYMLTEPYHPKIAVAFALPHIVHQAIETVFASRIKEVLGPDQRSLSEYVSGEGGMSAQNGVWKYQGLVGNTERLLMCESGRGQKGDERLFRLWQILSTRGLPEDLTNWRFA